VLFFKAISHLPFWSLYLLADFFAFIANYVLQYRKQVVLDNLRHAFPKKSEGEIRKIANQFYRDFADSAVETLKTLTMSEEELSRRVITDDHVSEYIRKNGRSAFFMGSHVFNWEWFFLANCSDIGYPVYGIYQRLSNNFFDKLMQVIRTRFGTLAMERGHILRHAIRTRDEVKVYATLADLRPAEGENKYWTKFMNRDAAFFTGTEKLARKLQYTVIYFKSTKIRRGYYKSESIIIDEPPFKTKPFEITERFVRLVEQDIMRSPSSYLWSHNRWKFRTTKQTI
jgi:KDO2-lipid IV(A) lauroyltransferase